MPSTIVATTTNGLVQTADNSGVLQLASGTGNLVTVPAVTGTVMVNGPAFSANHSTGGDQSVSANTWTKILFETEEFDTANCYSSSRFTPNVNGYYQVNSSVFGGGAIQVRVYKNGSSLKAIGTTTSVANLIAQGSCLVYLNGTTDYIEIYGYISSTAFYTDAPNMYFQACLVRTA